MDILILGVALTLMFTVLGVLATMAAMSPAHARADRIAFAVTAVCQFVLAGGFAASVLSILAF